LQCGKTLAPIDVAYETYGQMNAAGDNVVYICHALSGDAHAAGYHSPQDEKSGWWDVMIGPGKGIDTDRYYVICSNFLGGCAGTTGPSSTNPATGKPYGLDFPMITVADMVRVQKLLLDRLGVTGLLAVIGGSMGGMQALQWAIEYPDFVKSAVVIAASTHLGPQAIAFDAVGRNAILADRNFAGGQYVDAKSPDHGLAIARMIGHITYLSEEGMREKFGRDLRKADTYSYDFDSEFAVETYLDYQGQARDYGSLEAAFAKTKARFLIGSFTSDWLFTLSQSEDMVRALIANTRDVSYCNIQSPYGHDAFLLEPETLGKLISGFLLTTHARIKGSPQQVRFDLPVPKPIAPAHAARMVRVDYELIESLIEPGSNVLDIGCGDGELLARLWRDKNIRAEGIELQEDLVVHCVRRGLSVIQYDVERGLAGYADKSFDYVILSQTVQTLKNPQKVLEELLRVGRRVIVSFPNFAYWRSRAQLFFKGTAPVTRQLPFRWHNSPNIHFSSLKDFDNFCRELNVRIERRIPLVKSSLAPVTFAANFFAEQAIYVTSRE